MYHDNTMKRSKTYRKVDQKIEDKVYSLKEAIALLVANPLAKFDESLEVHVRLAIDPKKGDQQVRSSVTLPHGTGKERRIAVITTTATKEAKEANADLVGGEEIIEDIKSGKFFDEKYDVLVATPEMMPKLAPAARILGPRGMMPNPKSDTVTTKIAEVVTSLKKGKLQYKNDNTGNIHQAVGKRSMGEQKLQENVQAFIEAIQKAKPEGVKGKYMVNVSLCTTMSPGIAIEF